MAAGNVLILLTLGSIALLLVLILYLRLHAFLALLLTSMALGLAAGMPPARLLKSIQTGFGDALGFIAVVVALGRHRGADARALGRRTRAGRLVVAPVRTRACDLGRPDLRVPGRAPHFLRGRIHHHGAAGLEPCPRIEEVAALFRAAHRGRAHGHPRHGSTAPGPGGGGATAGRGPRPCDPCTGSPFRSRWPSREASSTGPGSRSGCSYRCPRTRPRTQHRSRAPRHPVSAP